VDGFFLAIGHIPNTKVFRGQIETDAEGYIVSKGGARTSIPGSSMRATCRIACYRQPSRRRGRLRGAIEVETIPGSGRTLRPVAQPLRLPRRDSSRRSGGPKTRLDASVESQAESLRTETMVY